MRIHHLHANVPVSETPLEGRRLRISGTVQGVGFRPWVYRLAQTEAIRGRVRNDNAGVTIDAFGTPATLQRFAQRLANDPTRPAAARINRIEIEKIEYEAAAGFAIVDSRAGDEVRVSIPPDLATCPECLGEIHDPANRRYGYAFTTCTNCGPRFTIVRATP